MSIKNPIRSSIQRAAFYAALGLVLGGCGWLPPPTTDAESFVPHTLDVVQTAAVISDGGIELNPVGWPGVTFVKIGTEIIARQQQRGSYRSVLCAGTGWPEWRMGGVFRDRRRAVRSDRHRHDRRWFGAAGADVHLDG